ncbi:AMP-binding protein [Streptomyces sp. NPDC002054]|uniref:AMP-binding protein n=1 Tax=Streptomyces sp. NPDC002054 TaxID=3154663 RepID=UPI0033342D7E
MTQEPDSHRSGPRTTDTVLHLFEQAARDTPEAVAVSAGALDISYGQLDRQANRLAHHLLAAGLPAGGTVAVGHTRQADVLTAVLAVLKAGGTYTIVDPAQAGPARIQVLRTGPFALLTDTALQAALDSGDGLRLICPDAEAEAIGARAPESPGIPPAPVAALLWTGGEVPRAVPVGQARLLAAHRGWAEVGGLTPADRHLITSRPDVTAFAAGWTRALCSGATLVLAEHTPGDGRTEAEEIRRLIGTAEVTAVHTDPAGAASLLAQPDPQVRPLRLVTVTGDRLYLDEQAALQGGLLPGARLVSVYGTAETAGVGSWFELPQLTGPVDRPEGTAPAGTPFPGCRLELHDGEIHLTPPDGGAAVPTGDLGRLRPDGLLEFAGRIRDRFTLGRRTVDPYRLESALREHPAVGGALVRSVSHGPLQERLVAYIAPPAVPVAQTADSRVGYAWLPGADELRTRLKGRLREEDLPKTVVRLRSLPRNRAGQEDRSALPMPPKPTGGYRGKYSSSSDYDDYYADTMHAPLRTSGGKGSVEGAGCCSAIVLAVVAMLFTDALWPGSTELSGVPAPWSVLFFLLYCFECLAFATGVVFLFTGRSRMLRSGRSRGFTRAAHLAVVYLLIAWWPQDNLYRLAAKNDWPQQAALVYTFNIPLMIAAAILAVYVTRRPVVPPEPEPEPEPEDQEPEDEGPEDQGLEVTSKPAP